MSARNVRSGFAIVIAVSLLAFLALLLVGMGVLAASHSRQTGASIRQKAARDNALFALDIALAELQRWAGPDRRVTASGDSYATANSHLTGVWNSTISGSQPLAWLVSGNDSGDPLAIGPASAIADPIALVSSLTSGVADAVVAPKQILKSPAIPGYPADIVLGKYAWWVGDQGIKAPVGIADRIPDIDSSYFSSNEIRNRLYQQLGMEAGAADFESGDPANTEPIRNVTAYGQLAFLKRSDGSPVGSAAARSNYFAWSSDNFDVLADTAHGGLRRDLSLNPDALGSAFAAWANFPAYMEDPSLGAKTPVPSPNIANAESLRRRYRMTPPHTASGIAHGVAPVLSYCLLAFNVRTDQSVSGGQRPIEIRARWMISLWNPYTSALVPEDLQLEIQGLPAAVQFVNDTAGGTVVCTFSVDAAFGAPLRVSLPWQTNGRDDCQSWLPGRVYTWSAFENLAKVAPVPANGFASQFYTRNLSASAGQGVQRPASASTMSNAAQAHIAVAATSQLTLRLYRVPPTGSRELLATFLSPSFLPFVTTPATASSGTYQFAYFFRLAESIDTIASPGTWLSTPGQDPRESILPGGSYVPGNNGNRPEQYPNFTSISFPDRLLDRALPATASTTTGQSYNEDTPLFELPRAPVLSLGALQHLPTAGTRPYAIGNSWGGAGGWNALFDRYFFSGLTTDVAPDPARPFPSPFLHPIKRHPDGTPLAPAELSASDLSGFSSKYLLQGAAFNLNSVNRDAWIAVLRSVRFPAPRQFTYLAASASTGTAGDSTPAILTSGNAQFFRFSLSAQETEQADSPTPTSTYAASTTVPPSLPNAASNANTHLFRRGVRVLNSAQVMALANAVVAAMHTRQVAFGPCRSLEEFLNPSPLFVDASGLPISLLEKAISDAGLNTGIAEFSSQWLTQADIMTALAPILFCRSDTFVIRTYGESIDPKNGQALGRAWAEAVVQRTPNYCDLGNPPETAFSDLNPTNVLLGRRFVMVSFRWLPLSEL